MIKYAVYPGFVISKTDGDKHFITEYDLMSLYGVHQSECVVIDHKHHPYQPDFLENLIHLSPKYNGEYVLPAVTHVLLTG